MFKVADCINFVKYKIKGFQKGAKMGSTQNGT